MSAEAIDIKQNCRKCGNPLTLEEMHFYDQGNGEATCNCCETKWADEMNEWMSDDGGDMMPTRP